MKTASEKREWSLWILLIYAETTRHRQCCIWQGWLHKLHQLDKREQLTQLLLVTTLVALEIYERREESGRHCVVVMTGVCFHKLGCICSLSQCTCKQNMTYRRLRRTVIPGISLRANSTQPVTTTMVSNWNHASFVWICWSWLCFKIDVDSSQEIVSHANSCLVCQMNLCHVTLPEHDKTYL